MDPSSTNNNSPQYYPPPQQNYPTQQGYPSANPYPPQQSYPTQQGYPPANPYPQQGYPPADLYQSPQQGYPSANPDQYDQQQPQIPGLTQDLNDLDVGWFKCYKIVLGFVLLSQLLQLLSSFQLITAGGIPSLYGLMIFLCSISMMAMAVIQFLAMRDRDLQKAKIALIGFLSVNSLFSLSYIAFNLFMYGSEGVTFQIILTALFNFAIYGGLTLIGSFKVYELLNANQIKSESDIYQNQNQDQSQNQNQNQNLNYYAA